MGFAHAEQVADGDHALGEKGRSDPGQGAVDPPSPAVLQDVHRGCAGDPIPSPSTRLLSVSFTPSFQSQSKIKARRRRRRRERVLVSSQSEDGLACREMSRQL